MTYQIRHWLPGVVSCRLGNQELSYWVRASSQPPGGSTYFTQYSCKVGHSLLLRKYSTVHKPSLQKQYIEVNEKTSSVQYSGNAWVRLPYITCRNSTCLPGVLGEITFLGVGVLLFITCLRASNSIPVLSLSIGSLCAPLCWWAGLWWKAGTVCGRARLQVTPINTLVQTFTILIQIIHCGWEVYTYSIHDFHFIPLETNSN